MDRLRNQSVSIVVRKSVACCPNVWDLICNGRTRNKATDIAKRSDLFPRATDKKGTITSHSTVCWHFRSFKLFHSSTLDISIDWTSKSFHFCFCIRGTVSSCLTQWLGVNILRTSSMLRVCKPMSCLNYKFDDRM